MKAFIFNSGVGSRLGELTKHSPKALLPLKNGETILGRQLRLLRKAKIKSVIISTGYLAKDIEDYCYKNFPDMNFTFTHNSLYDSTNSIYSLAISSHMLHTDFIVMHGDLVFDERIIHKLLDNRHPNLGCINTRIQKPLKDFKGKLIGGKLQKISVDMFTVDDFALQPIYKMSSELVRAWLKEIQKMIKLGFSDVYAENALNNILPNYDMRVIEYHKHFIEEIDTIEDYERVSNDVRAYDFEHQELYYGNYIKRLTEIFKKYEFKKPFIVYSSAVKDQPKFHEFAKNNNAILFHGYSPNPKYEEVLEGLKLFKENKCDVIIAIGGGSCMDVAKSIKMFSTMDPEVSYLEQTPKYVELPLVCVPTTAGTGSEATRYAVIYKDDVKQSLVHDSIFPNIAILDSWFLAYLPEYHRKASLLDAFCQAIEGYWAKSANDISRDYSNRALSLFMLTHKFYSDEYRFADPYMMKIAYLAGQSINVTTTTAPHAMSYKLTSMKGIAHGYAVGATLPYVYEYMLEQGKEDKSLMRTFDNLASILETTKEQLGDKLKHILNWFKAIKPEVTENQLVELVNSVNIERLNNNPLSLDKKAIESIYRKSLIVR